MKLKYVFMVRNIYGRLAQLVEHMTVNHGVVGSSPTFPAIKVIKNKRHKKTIKYLQVDKEKVLFKELNCLNCSGVIGSTIRREVSVRV